MFSKNCSLLQNAYKRSAERWQPHPSSNEHENYGLRNELHSHVTGNGHVTGNDHLKTNTDNFKPKKNAKSTSNSIEDC